MPTVHAFEYLAAAQKHPPGAVSVVFGGESYLKWLVLRELRGVIQGEGDAPYATFEGDEVEWRDVADELSTASLFGGGGPRLAVVAGADKFVTAHRDKLEDYVARARPSSALVLEARLWPGNTKLFKAIDKTGLQVDCRLPMTGKRKDRVEEGPIAAWLSTRADEAHDAQLSPSAARQLMDRVGLEIGVLDQELARLALFAGRGGKITPELIREVAGGWRTKTTWEMLDAAADGDAAAALEQLNHLFQSGEHPLAIFPQVAWFLRRFAEATRRIEDAERDGRPIRLGQALTAAGFRAWPETAFQRSEQQLRQIGRVRGGTLYQQLLAADLALKGSHSAEHRARLLLELLISALANELRPG